MSNRTLKIALLCCLLVAVAYIANGIWRLAAEASDTQKTFVLTCDKVQMVYHLRGGAHDATAVRCVTKDEPALGEGSHEGFLQGSNREPWRR